jgi:MFS transporter, DHA2 family, multidrug resistance protein
LTDRSGDALQLLSGSGMSQDGAVSQLNSMVDGQIAMIAANGLMLVIALAFIAAALVFWLAPPRARVIDPAQAGSH